jgi:hypothetical protein
MKKKYRNITVDNIDYAWMTSFYALTVWKNKKELFTTDVSGITVTPKIVADKIKEFNTI